MDRASLVEKLQKAMNLAAGSTGGERAAAQKAVERMTKRYPWLPEALAAAQAAASAAKQAPPEVDLSAVYARARPHAEQIFRRATERATSRIRSAIDDAVDGFVDAVIPPQEKPMRPKPEPETKRRPRKPKIDIDQIAADLLGSPDCDEKKDHTVLSFDVDEDDLDALLTAIEEDEEATHAAIGRAFVDALIELDLVSFADDEGEDDDED